jgi:hypothetical protein
MDWLSKNWITIVGILATPILGGIFWMIKTVVSKKLSPPMLRFEAVRDKGLTSSEVVYLVRIVSEPLQGITNKVAKRRDIQQAKVRVQFKHNNHVVSEQFLDSAPDGVQSVNILANNSTYDFSLVFKSEGYAECRGGGWGGDILPARTDILALVTVIEGQHILGQSNYIIHNPDEHIANFNVECTLR